MHPHAANPAAQPHLSLSLFSVPAASREERNGSGEKPSCSGASASSVVLRFAWTSAAEKQWGDTVQSVPSASYPVLCSVTASGPNRRPAARRRSASLPAPLRGRGSSPKKFVNRGKERRTTSFGPLPESTPWHLGAGPTRSRCECDPSRIREINETEITTMYQNKVTLSASSATTQKFAPTTTAASPLSRWQPRAPIRRTASTSRTPNGTVA